MTDKITRSELAIWTIWAEGTQYTAEELASRYADYAAEQDNAGISPLSECAWANTVLGISNE